MAPAGPKPRRVGDAWAPHWLGVRHGDLGFAGKQAANVIGASAAPLRRPPRHGRREAGMLQRTPRSHRTLGIPGVAPAPKPPSVPDGHGEGERGHRGGERTSARRLSPASLARAQPCFVSSRPSPTSSARASRGCRGSPAAVQDPAREAEEGEVGGRPRHGGRERVYSALPPSAPAWRLRSWSG